MKNYSRYAFAKDPETGAITATNVATGEPMALQELYPGSPKFFRVTDDDGKRVRLYLEQIEFPAPKVEECKPAGPPMKCTPVKKGKLTMADAKAIRAAKALGSKTKDLVELYQVNKSTIADIVNGRIYNDGSIVYTKKR